MAGIPSRQRRRRGRTAAAMAGVGVLTVALVLPWSGDGIGGGKGPGVGNAVGGGPDMDCGPLFEGPVAGAYYFVCRPRPTAKGDDGRLPGDRPGQSGGERLWLAATLTGAAMNAHASI